MFRLTAALGILAIGVVLLFGLYLFLKGARNIQMAVASTNWPKTPSVVVRSDTTRSVTRSTRTSSGSVSFNTRTVIRYTVDKRDYSTDVLHFGQTLGSGDKSEAALQSLRYPPGKKVVVSYNPRNPSTAVMKPGLHAEAFWLPGAGLAFLLPAVLCLMLGPTMLRTLTSDDEHAFSDSVRSAIEEARLHGTMPSPIAPPQRTGGDAVMVVVAAAFGALACGLGVLALTAGLQRIWHGAASQAWPTAPGEVVFAAGEGGNDTTDPTYYARFVYEYEVAGTRHFNNVRRFAQIEGGSAEEADRVADRYIKGAAVRVSYFPADPDVSVLEPGNASASLVVPGLGVVLLLFGLAVFIWIVPAVAR